MSTPATWKIIEWADRPAETDVIPLRCRECACESDLPCDKVAAERLIAITSHGILIFDPPNVQPRPGWLPEVIECPHCKNVLTNKIVKEANDVR